MKTSPLVLLAACAVLASLAAAHHETDHPGRAGLSVVDPGSHPASAPAGPGHFVSTFPGGDFTLPGASR